MAFLERPDMPHSIFGIPGLNPWNIVLLITLFSWMNNRKHENLVWDMPSGINKLLILQLILFSIGFLRIFYDNAGLKELHDLQSFGLGISTGADLWNSYFINTFKWVIPGLLLFHGCNSRSRLFMAIFSLLAMYLLLSLLIYKAIPPWKIIDVDSLTKYAIKLDRRVGYHRVDLSAMLAGASWGFFSAIILVKHGWQKAGLLLAGGMVILGQALTGGRAGYLAWCVAGLFFGLFRWRKLLIFIPLTILLLMLFIPQIKDRILVGFVEDQEIVTSQYDVDVKTLTAGRDGIWQLTFDEFKNAPLLGHGRLAIHRTGVVKQAIEDLGEPFGHPHNAYLEQLVDNGIIGLICTLLLYFALLRIAFSLLQDKDSAIHVAIGGFAFALILTQLVASMTAQSFYPRQGVVGMWCAIGLMLRVHAERLKANKLATPISTWNPSITRI